MNDVMVQHGVVDGHDRAAGVSEDRRDSLALERLDDHGSAAEHGLGPVAVAVSVSIAVSVAIAVSVCVAVIVSAVPSQPTRAAIKATKDNRQIVMTRIGFFLSIFPSVHYRYAHVIIQDALLQVLSVIS